jgi:RNA polymerase sigma-B factor
VINKGWLGEAQARQLVAAARAGDHAARDRLIEGYFPLVKALARRFANRGEQLDDLAQVGTLGLIAAIDRFDSDRNVEFRTFAIPTITGAIKHHLRDRTSAIRIPRRLHELAPSVRRRELELSARLDRPPSAAEVALDMGLRESEIRDVLAARRARAPLSIADLSREPARLGDNNGTDVYESVADRLTLTAGLRALSPRDRCILHLRFVDELTQAEIAERLGISQVHVSRLIRSAVATLRRQLADDEEPSAIGDAA